MTMTRRMRVVVLAALTALVSVLMAGPALAHVSITPSEATVGSTAVLEFKVGHGCDGSPTNEVSIQIPAGISAVRAEPIAGWELSYDVGTLPEPVESGDETITEGVVSVTWSGGSLPDDHIQRFTIQVGLPAEGEGTTLWFPTVQTCDEGEIAWINIPAAGEDPHSVDEPAPGLALLASEGDGHGHGESTDDASDDEMAEEGHDETGDDANAQETSADVSDGEVVVAAVSEGDGGSDALTWAAFIIGLLGLGTAAYALTRVRRP